jgi:hypothetical protein
MVLQYSCVGNAGVSKILLHLDVLRRAERSMRFFLTEYEANVKGKTRIETNFYNRRMLLLLAEFTKHLARLIKNCQGFLVRLVRS